MSELYDTTLDVQMEPVPNSEGIGSWLNQAKDESAYFAQPLSKLEDYVTREPKNQLFNIAKLTQSMDDDNHYITVTRTRSVIKGYSPTTKMPYRYLKVTLSPSLPNIAPEECLIVPIVSRTHLRIFWSFRHFEYVDWEKSKPIGTPKWATLEISLKDLGALERLIRDLSLKFEDFVETPLRARLNFSTEPAAENEVNKDEKFES